MRLISLNTLRAISLVEGISYLLLLFIGMPLKYGLGLQEINFIIGAAHGILTIIFCVVLGVVWLKKILPLSWCLGVFIASLIPFGAFVAEKKLKSEYYTPI
jgi:integral membrane protein